MFRKSVICMKRLYLIIVVLFMVSCSKENGAVSQPSVGQSPPTVPAEWLTQPPTPLITPSALAIPQANVPNPVDTPTRRPGAAELAVEVEEATAVPTITETATPLIIPTAAFDQQLTITAESNVPEALANAARQLAELRPHDFSWIEPGSGTADITLQAGAGTPLANWVYVVAAPFATIADGLALADVQSLWTGTATGEGPLIITENTAAALAPIWGTPGAAVIQASADTLHDSLWTQRPSLTILPFDQLTPDLKAMQLDGVSPLGPDFTTEDYPLLVSVGIAGDEAALANFMSAWPVPETNRDPAKLTRVAMTGVTALVRATASQMETDGILAPGTDVGPVLREADVAHISNEVTFAEDCPEPNPIGGTTFCSQDDYFALLEDLGTDVVELTGNHLNDWGPESLVHTLEMYKAADMAIFGGGRDMQEAVRPAIFEHNGNKIAFVGCNPVGPNYAWAGISNGGSRPCDPDFEQQIRDLTEQGYLVIATQQYYEFYHYEPTGLQVEDFRAIADAGAAAVSGSQGHHAQGFDFHNNAFIHYGLGNLFFDQMDMLGTRQTFVDTYVIYEGKLLNVELWTGLIEDYSKPRLMTAEEREEALQAVFQASGW